MLVNINSNVRENLIRDRRATTLSTKRCSEFQAYDLGRNPRV
jgi:hypothetical protein